MAYYPTSDTQHEHAWGGQRLDTVKNVAYNMLYSGSVESRGWSSHQYAMREKRNLQTYHL